MYPTLPNSMWPPFSLDTNDLSLQLWSSDGGESILDHHTSWQLRWGRFLHCVSLKSTQFWCYWYLFVTERSFSVGTLTSPTHFPGFTVPNQRIASCCPISRMMTNQRTVSLILWSMGNSKWLIRDWLHNPLVICCHTSTSSTSTTQMVLPTRHYKWRWFPTLCVHLFAET